MFVTDQIHFLVRRRPMPIDNRPNRQARVAAVLAAVTCTLTVVSSAHAQKPWKKHVIFEGGACATCVAGDFTGDGVADVICNSGRRTILLQAPDWKRIVLEGELKLNFIHSETMDVDGDGDLDFIGARYKPGRIVWLEQPKNPTTDRWPLRLVDDQVDGIHGLLVGDVDGDGRQDLLANSAQPNGPFAESLVWYQRELGAAPAKSKSVRWKRRVIADHDAPGLSHYLGIGDVNGDGRADAASAAKGGPNDKRGLGNWFAWWEAPKDPTQVWKKHMLSDDEPGATNIHPADVDGDGKTDFIASRGHGRGVVWFQAPDWKRRVMHATLHGPHCLVVIDMDGDGDIDAATCAKDDKLAVWFENDGKGNFTTHVVAKNQAAYDIRALDMDADGDLDLIIAGQASENVVWCENPLR